RSFAGCADLTVALQKAKEDEALHRNTRGIAHFGRQDVQVVEVLPLSGPLEAPEDEALPAAPEVAEETALLEQPQPPATTAEADEEDFFEEYAETMEELLRDTLQEPAPLLAQPYPRLSLVSRMP